MVTKRKTVVLLGHSNGNGWAGTRDLFNSAPHLRPTASPDDFPQAANVYPGIYIATDPIPWPGANGTPDHSYSPGDIEWLEMTHNLPSSPGDAHPHPSPYHYPNIRGSWYPVYYADAINRAGGGTFCGVEIPLMWKLSHYWQSDDETGVGLVKQTLSSTLFQRFDQGGNNADWIDVFGYGSPGGHPQQHPGTVDMSEGMLVPWWTPSDKFDWAPNTGRLYSILLDRLAAAAANMPEGIEMDIDTVVPWFGDNDATLAGEDQERIREWEKNCRKFVAQIRADIADNGWSSKSPHEIKIVWMGVTDAYGSEDTQDDMNEALQRIEDDDPYFRYIDTTEYEFNSALGYSDALVASGSHFSANGYLTAADDIFDAIQEMDVEPYDALDEEQRITVDSAKDRIRTYYNRSRVNTDANDETLLQYINASYFDILNDIADNAWFLRRRMQLAISATAGQAYTLPRVVHRLLKIEEINNPTYPLKYDEVGRADGGKCQIVLRERTSGTFWIHFFTQPKEMTSDSDLIPLPFQMIEWLVVECAKRLARSSGNILLLSHLEAESQKQRNICMRNLGAMQQARRDRWAPQRRLPGWGRRRGFPHSWDRI